MQIEKLKIILREMNYIYDIFDDIRNLYNFIECKNDIYNLYNINDLLLLDKITALCNHIMYRHIICNDIEFKLQNEIEAFCEDIIKTYNHLENITKENNSLKEALRNKNDFFIYDNKEYIYMIKTNLNLILHKY